MWIFHWIVQEENTAFHNIKYTYWPLISFLEQLIVATDCSGKSLYSSRQVGKLPLLPSSSSRDTMVSIRTTSEFTEECLSGCIPLHLSTL